MKIKTDKNERHGAEASWCIMFADYVVLVDDNKNESGGKLERWKEVLEKIGLKYVGFRFKNDIGVNRNDRNVRLTNLLIK